MCKVAVGWKWGETLKRKRGRPIRSYKRSSPWPSLSASSQVSFLSNRSSASFNPDCQHPSTQTANILLPGLGHMLVEEVGMETRKQDRITTRTAAMTHKRLGTSEMPGSTPSFITQNCLFSVREHLCGEQPRS